jgi:hypothetical protein
LIRLRGWVCLVESDEAEEELGKKRDSKGVGARVVSFVCRRSG